MKNRNSLFVAMMTSALLSSGCGELDSGISQRDYDKVVNECDELKEELAAKDETISELNKQIEALEGQVKSSGTTFHSEGIESEMKESDAESIWGTYIGDNGSLLILMKDGQALYYDPCFYSAHNESNWEYNDGKLNVLLFEYVTSVKDNGEPKNIEQIKGASDVESGHFDTWTLQVEKNE